MTSFPGGSRHLYIWAISCDRIFPIRWVFRAHWRYRYLIRRLRRLKAGVS
jgi:hypothetical protein